MYHAVRLMPIATVVLLAACSRDAPLDPEVVTDGPLELSTAERLVGSPEEVVSLLVALEDALTRELPELEHPAEAGPIGDSLRELISALATNERSPVVGAVRTARGALEAYRTGSPDITADLATLGAIGLVFERVESITARVRDEFGSDSEEHEDIR